VTVRALVVEDERKMAALLRRGLVEEGYAADVSRTGRDAIEMAGQSEYDVIVLDVMLPDLDGLGVCRALREGGVWTPILMLTALDRVQDRVAGLDAGADDYLTKPFKPSELMARIRAVLRRKLPEALDAAVAVGELSLDPATRRVRYGRDELQLGPTEFRLLRFLMTYPERVHSRAQLLDRVWGDHVFIEERTVDVHIKRLRGALAPAGCDGLIETVRGAGYRLSRPQASAA
jgi:two-component system phosphate regulon response regulator PhoB